MPPNPSNRNRIRIIENTILAKEIGIDVESGTAFVGTNRIAKVRTAGILASAQGQIRAVDNDVDPAGDGCPTLKWGNIEPAARVCTPWYKGSEFDVPGDAFFPEWRALGFRETESEARVDAASGLAYRFTVWDRATPARP